MARVTEVSLRRGEEGGREGWKDGLHGRRGQGCAAAGEQEPLASIVPTRRIGWMDGNGGGSLS